MSLPKSPTKDLHGQVLPWQREAPSGHKIHAVVPSSERSDRNPVVDTPHTGVLPVLPPCEAPQSNAWSGLVSAGLQLHDDARPNGGDEQVRHSHGILEG